MANHPKSIAVLGAGITGLATAYRLTTLGHRVRLFERSPRIGGAIRTECSEGWLVEAGPNSFQESSPEVTALLTELGLDAERVESNPATKKRYLVRGGRLRAAPLSPPAFLASSLFSPATKLRVLREFFSPPRVRTADLSIAELVRAHFGQEVIDYGLQPFVSGIYAGDPEKLSARHAFPKLWELERTHGSFLKGQKALAKSRKERGEPAGPRIISFQRGLQTLPNALAARLGPDALVRNARIQALIPGATWQVIWQDETNASHTEAFDRVIATVPANALSQLSFGALGERPLAVLESVPHPPVASLFLGFHRSQVDHPLDGFGALVPAVEKRSVLGLIFSSSLFPQRAPEGHVALTVMAGGTLQPELGRLSADALWSRVRDDLRDLLGVTGAPLFMRHNAWPRAIPQYVLGYEHFLEAITACERAYPGFFVAGNVRDGIALPSCLCAGLKIAGRAAA